MSEKTITAQAVPMPNGGYYFPFGESVTMDNGQTMRMAWTITSKNMVGEFVVMDAQGQIDDSELPDPDEYMCQVEAWRDGIVVVCDDESVHLDLIQEERLLNILIQRKAEREVKHVND